MRISPGKRRSSWQRHPAGLPASAAGRRVGRRSESGTALWRSGRLISARSGRGATTVDAYGSLNSARPQATTRTTRVPTISASRCATFRPSGCRQSPGGVDRATSTREGPARILIHHGSATATPGLCRCAASGPGRPPPLTTFQVSILGRTSAGLPPSQRHLPSSSQDRTVEHHQ